MKASGRSLGGSLAVYTLPIIGSQMLSLFGGTASKAFLAHLVGMKALATSALPLPWIGLCIAVAAGLTGGALVTISRARSGDAAALRRTCGEALGAAVLLGMLFAAAGVVFAPQILHLQHTPQRLLALGIPYARLAALSLPLTFLYMMYGTIREALGDTRTPLIMLASYIVLYVALIPALVLGLGPVPAMGTLAAPVAQLVAIALVVLCAALVFRMPFRMPAHAALQSMIAIDVPISAQYTGVAIADIVIFRFANQQGVASIAVYTAMLTVIAYAMVPAAVLETPANVFTGEALGGNRLSEARQTVRFTLAAVCVASIAAAVALYAFASPVLGMMLPGRHSLPLGLAAAFSMLWSVPLLNAGSILCAIMRAGRQTLAPMITTLGAVLGMQLPFTWWLASHADPLAIWKGYAFAYTAAGALQIGYFFLVWSRKNMGADVTAPMPA